MLLKRLVAFAIDYFIALGVCFPMVLFDYPIYLGVIPILLVMLKDISGKSVGKRIIGLEIIHLETGGPVKKGYLFLRNVTFLLNWFELLVAYVNKGKRIGDALAKTRVVELQQSTQNINSDNLNKP